MKLTCDLCEGTLLVDVNGQGAECADCGLYYPMARLREKLMAQKNAACAAAPVLAEPVVAEPEVAEPVVAEPVVAEPVVAEPEVAEPEVAEPVVAEPEVAEPVVAEPVVAEPVVEAPVAPVWEAPVVDPVADTPVAAVWAAPVEPKQAGFSDRSTWKKAADSLVGNIPEFAPRQFIMNNSGSGNCDFSGLVQQGGVGLGDKIYFDGDYAHPYTVFCINDDPGISSIKAGSWAGLTVAEQVSSKQMRTVSTISGSPTPIVSAYTYPGSTKLFFTYLLVNAFSQYEIYADVAHGQLSVPIDYLFCQNGTPVLAVFVINSNNGKDRYQAEKAARIFRAEGISCTHFYENYRNDTPYVIKRVNEALG